MDIYMTNPGTSGLLPDGPDQRRKSRNQAFLLFGLVVLIGVVFGAIHLFGQRFGVSV